MTELSTSHIDTEIAAREEDRLEELQHGIDETREAAREHGLLLDEDEPTYNDPNPDRAQPGDDLDAMP